MRVVIVCDPEGKLRMEAGFWSRPAGYARADCAVGRDALVGGSLIGQSRVRDHQVPSPTLAFSVFALKHYRCSDRLPLFVQNPRLHKKPPNFRGFCAKSPEGQGISLDAARQNADTAGEFSELYWIVLPVVAP